MCASFGETGGCQRNRKNKQQYNLCTKSRRIYSPSVDISAPVIKEKNKTQKACIGCE